MRREIEVKSITGVRLQCGWCDEYAPGSIVINKNGKVFYDDFEHICGMTEKRGVYVIGFELLFKPGTEGA